MSMKKVFSDVLLTVSQRDTLYSRQMEQRDKKRSEKYRCHRKKGSVKVLLMTLLTLL